MTKILPVVFGFDIADYAFARIFHENCGIRSLMVTEIRRGPINDSSIFDTMMVPKGTLGHEESFIALLHEIEEAHPDEQLILCVNSDEGVEYAAKHRGELEERWFLPYPSEGAVRTANSKAAMAQILATLGLPTITSVSVDLTAPESWAGTLENVQFPVVVKPEDGTLLNLYLHKGLKKVVPVRTPGEAIELLTNLHEAGVPINLLVQELIPGDDTTQWVINGYVDSRGHVTAAGSGRVLLGLHVPSLIGNAGMILLERNDHLISVAKQIVAAVGLTGFFSMDVKIDPRDGTEYWLDLNPRIGRGHYYLKAAGIDLAAAILADMGGEAIAYQTNSRTGIYTVIPMALASKKYIQDPDLMRQVKSAKKHTVNPLAYAKDRNLKRTTYRCLSYVNQYKQMRSFYPEPTQSGF
ncbi:MAG: carboxylate--amine ligase [Ancrocorticia sp.]|uniref:carboxylate--amine ligase n=1 Tax=Ancrocorticia sp. TaxID=2593684 RepID=UPI003F9322C5